MRLIKWWRGEGGLSALECPFCGYVKSVPFCIPRCKIRHFFMRVMNRILKLRR